MADLSRRDFLKVVGFAGSTAALGCSSQSAQQLIPYIFPPEDIIPGAATWYATTCRECPAGCGLLAKNREGRVIKLEGNPLHPVNQGRLCARGQAALQGLYDPDRFKEPLLKNAQGRFETITWQQAEALLVQKIQQHKLSGKGRSALFLSGLETGTLKDLIQLWLGECGASRYVPYEAFAHEPLRAASQTVFGVNGIPAFRIDRADFLLSFGADFLETWLSPVEYSRQFAAFHAPQDIAKNLFIHVGPRLSLTAANADHWLCVPPGTEYLVALGMLRIILDENLCKTLQPEHKRVLAVSVHDVSIESVLEKTGINQETLRTLAKKFCAAQRPLALAGSIIGNPTETAVAANLLCSLIPGTHETIDLAQLSVISETAPAAHMKELTEQMQRKEVALLFINTANPVFTLPQAWEFQAGMAAVPFVVSFSSARDETSERADLILPTNTPLESWGDYSPRTSVIGFMQPVMGAVFNTRHLGDILLSTGRKLFGTEKFPWNNFYALLRETAKRGAAAGAGENSWNEAMKKGGVWESRDVAPALLPFKYSGFSFPVLKASASLPDSFEFITYPTIQFFDGRGANRPWLQELPDPITQITWGGWVEIHPDTAQKLNIEKGDILAIKSSAGI
ncbi:MAG: molybdopterin-dependent oxidoreductase, partial [Proteobacteria bacterium]|nr:molybdopterin-dependent oxidoreductase [Pseudomonadota bacterium]